MSIHLHCGCCTALVHEDDETCWKCRIDLQYRHPNDEDRLWGTKHLKDLDPYECEEGCEGRK